MKRTILPVIICMLMFFQNAAFAQVTTSLNSVEDAYLVTFGGGQGGNSYLKFDISSIPAEATIQNAVLRVNVKSLSLGW
ncbi:MAG: hypothetical protein KKA07_03480, partial [Bacteroidetes bacterium]|nr:hypothetical protein [Bacteroidota bacterium]